jgi:hypothetical protein
MVAMLVNSRWQTGAVNRRRLHHPAFDASVMLTNRIVWFSNVDGKPATSLREDHCWLVLGLVPHSRPYPAAVCRQGC